jgi:hypothetical protein
VIDSFAHNMPTITCEFVDYIFDRFGPTFFSIYLMGGVVDLSSAFIHAPIRVLTLGTDIDFCLGSERAGRLYLIGVPPLILSSEELVEAGDNANEVAKVKLFDSRPLSRGGRPRTSWELWKSRVHLVNPGFRPTVADLTAD